VHAALKAILLRRIRKGQGQRSAGLPGVQTGKDLVDRGSRKSRPGIN
jgi:hypothetical protein